MRKNRNDTGLQAIRIEGGLLSSTLLTLLRHYQLSGQTPEEYGIEKGLKLNDELSRYWRIAQARWQQFSDLNKRDDLDHDTVAKENWLIPLFTRVLDFQIEESRPIHVGERTFPITHTAFNGSVPFVLTGPEHALEKGDPQFGEEGRKRSPAGLLQEYINANDCCLWAIVSNGLTLRLLRDNPAMTRPAYVEVDLERLFEEELYVDFTVLWLLLHASRLEPRDNSPENCILEHWRNQGQVDGERVLGELRHGVTNALRIMGTGFVAHPNNLELRESIKNEKLTTDQLFQELLRLIYRFLFLLTTEDRDILLDPAADNVCKKLYREGYSISILRDRSRFRRHYDNYGDGWQQLCITFAGFATGQCQLAQPALGGLFSADQCPRLEQAQLANRYLYDALFKLCYFESKGVLTRINYKDMDTEELGSVYESLLELIPQLNTNGQWRFGFLGDEADDENATGHTRKLTGSYYTPDSLVQELIKSALEPVIEDRLTENKGQPREALLGISVCDPACGSGHFLLAAARRLAAELARIEAGTDQPTEANYRHALREVVSHCIYGVDINPLAVELCRTALWLEAIEPGKPLGFLDAHIQVGNSLVGVLDPKILQDGIPDAAFMPLSGDDRETTRNLLSRNRVDPRQKELIYGHIPELAACVGDFAAMPEESLEQVEQKRDAWLAMVHGDACQDEKLIADLYTAAFFALKVPGNAVNVPTNVELAAPRRGETINPTLRRSIARLAAEHRFFHWHLAFPEVFEKGGFDVLLGNPPWERIKLQEKEFFAPRSLDIANAPNASARRRKIKTLAIGSPAEQTLYQNFFSAKQAAEAISSFARNSGRYPLTGRGDINLYVLFAEHFAQAMKDSGQAGLLIPTGVATDDTTKYFFNNLLSNNKLDSLISFYEVRQWFKGTDDRKSFCLLTLGFSEHPQFIFNLKHIEEIKEREKWFSLSPKDFQLINPNTRTCPIFRSKKDAELSKKIYNIVPILIKEENEDNPASNRWGIKFSRMFDMANDSDLFTNMGQIQGLGADSDGFLPLYEAKMVHHYDHRWATYDLMGDDCRDCILIEKQNPNFKNLPRYWVDSWEVILRTARAPQKILVAAKNNDSEVLTAVLKLWTAGKALLKNDIVKAEKLLNERQRRVSGDLSPQALESISLEEEWPLSNEEYDQLISVLEIEAGDVWSLTRILLRNRSPKYLLGFRDIALSSVERTVIAGVIPFSAVGHKLPIIYLGQNIEIERICCFYGNLNSIVLDYIARQKVSGTSLTYHYLKQFPIIPPDKYSETDFVYIIPRVLELTYTSHDLKAFAMDLGYNGEPFSFDPERRHQLKCELDAYYACLYGLTRDELRYILNPADVMGEDYPSETFRVLKNKEMNDFGKYRTRDLVLEAWDQLEADERFDPQDSVEVFAPPSYPETETDKTICAAALAIVEQAKRLSSIEHLDILLLTTHRDICKMFLRQNERVLYEKMIIKAPGDLFVSDTQLLNWRQCRSYLEACRAVVVNRKSAHQPMDIGEYFSSTLLSFPQDVKQIVQYAIKAMERLKKLREDQSQATESQRNILPFFAEQHRKYRLAA